MSVLCTICARGGSKELKNKALKKVFNKPLISYTIRQAIKSKTFDNIVLSTRLKKIQRAGKKYGAKSWFLRPKNYQMIIVQNYWQLDMLSPSQRNIMERNLIIVLI